MKTRIILLLLLAFSMTSCNWFKDLFRTDIETTLEVTVPVAVTEGLVIKSTGGATDYSFSESATLLLAENDDVLDHIDKIKSISIQSLEVDIFGLQAGQEIISLTVSVSGVGTIVSLANITSSSGTFVPDVATNLLDQVAQKLLDNESITVTVSGTTNYAPMTFNIVMAFETLVEAGLL